MGLRLLEADLCIYRFGPGPARELGCQEADLCRDPFGMESAGRLPLLEAGFCEYLFGIGAAREMRLSEADLRGDPF